MPITREQFQAGLNEKIQEWQEKVVEFLQTRINEAFTESELRQQFRIQTHIGGGASNDELAFSWALENLIETGKVETRVVGREKYYAYRAKYAAS